MSAVLEPDPAAGGAYLHALAHLTTPLAGGAADREVPVDAAGVIEVDRPSRKPVVLVAPRIPLGAAGLRLVTAVVDDAGAATPLPPLDFAPWTESRAFLPLYRPPVAAGAQTAGPFTIRVTGLDQIQADGSVTPIPAREYAGRLEVRLLEGDLGRLLYVLGAEHARIRRQAREIAAMRTVATARSGALDRLGAEAGVPRFADHPVVRGDAVVFEARPEPDAEYRRRLRIYRPFRLPTRRAALHVLNGSGPDADPNGGALGELGFAARLRLVEDNRPVAVAVVPLFVGTDGERESYLNWLRAVHLVDPAEDVPAERYLPSARRRQEDELRARLRDRFDVPAGVLLAPTLARALDRVGRCRAALGETTRRQLLAPAADAPPSRYELSLGADLAAPPAAELDRLAERLADPARTPAADPVDEQLLRGLNPRPAAEDPEGHWLLAGCGLRTTHPLAAGRTYVSCLPSAGLAIQGTTAVPDLDDLRMIAFHHAPGDPGDHVSLVHGMAAVEAAWQAANGEPLTTLDESAAAAMYRDADPPQPPALAVVRAAGLPDPPSGTTASTIGLLLPTRLLRAVRLGPQLAAAVLAGDAAAVAPLRHLRELIAAAGIASVVAVLVPDAGAVVLTVGLIGLPAAGLNLADRRAAGFRWQVVPLASGGAGTIDTIENTALYTPQTPGVYAGIVLAYARRPEPDPFQVRVEATSPGRMDFLAYEWLLNALDHVRPLGVEIDTSVIRRERVDLDSDGAADPLPVSVSRAFRPYRLRPRAAPKGPEIISVEPASCRRDYGVAVTIRGRLLAGASAIVFDGPGMGATVFWSTDTRVMATIFARADAPAGERTFRLQTPRGSVLSPIPFTVTAQAAVTGLAPSSGRQGTSVPVVITGERLAGATGITFPFQAADVVVTSLTSSETAVHAVFVIDPHALDGPRQFEVQTPQGTAPGGPGLAFEVLHRPKVFSIITNMLPQGSAPAELVIAGTALAGATAVEFPAGSGITAHIQPGGDDTTLPVRVTVDREAPTDASTFRVRIPLPPPLEVADSAEFDVRFTVLPRPRITGIDPVQARPGDPPFEVTIRGTALTGASSVTFSGDGVSATLLPGGSDTVIRARVTVAPGAQTGPRTFAAIMPLPAPLNVVSSAETAVTLTVVATAQPALPTITGIKPTILFRGGSSQRTLTIYGTNLAGVTSVQFRRLDLSGGGPVVLAIRSNTDTHVVVFVQMAALGDYLFNVTTPQGTADSETENVQLTIEPLIDPEDRDDRF